MGATIKNILWGVVAWAICAAVYDAGKRAVVRDCHEYHTFTYDRGAYFCKKLRTAREREKEEAYQPAKDDIKI